LKPEKKKKSQQELTNEPQSISLKEGFPHYDSNITPLTKY